MRLHKREEVVRKAQVGLGEAMIKWRKEHGEELTFPEEMKVVQGELGDWLLRMAKYAIRVERHGDADKPGGLE